MPLLQPWSFRLDVCTHIYTHCHIHALTHTQLISSLFCEGDLYRAEKQVGWHFGALALGEGFERKYIQLCLWNVLARMCKDFELSPRMCSCWTPVTVACAFPFIWHHADSNIFLNSTSLGLITDYPSVHWVHCRASNKWAWAWEQPLLAQEDDTCWKL